MISLGLVSTNGFGWMIEVGVKRFWLFLYRRWNSEAIAVIGKKLFDQIRSVQPVK